MIYCKIIQVFEHPFNMFLEINDDFFALKRKKFLNNSQPDMSSTYCKGLKYFRNDRVKRYQTENNNLHFVPKS